MMPKMFLTMIAAAIWMVTVLPAASSGGESPGATIEALLADHDQVVANFAASYRRQGEPRLLLIVNEDLFAGMAEKEQAEAQARAQQEAEAKAKAEAREEAAARRTELRAWAREDAAAGAKAPPVAAVAPAAARSNEGSVPPQPVINITVANDQTQDVASAPAIDVASAPAAAPPEGGTREWKDPDRRRAGAANSRGGGTKQPERSESTKAQGEKGAAATPAGDPTLPSAAEQAWAEQIFQQPFLEARARFAYLPAVRLEQQQAALEAAEKRRLDALLAEADLLLQVKITKRKVPRPTLSDPAATGSRLVVAARVVDLRQARELGAVNSETLFRARSFDERMAVKRLVRHLDDADYIEQAALRLMELMTAAEPGMKGERP